MSALREDAENLVFGGIAKAENVVKIKQANPTATEGMPVDLNNIQP